MFLTDRITNELGVPDYILTRLREPRFLLALVIPVIDEGERLIAQLGRIRDAAPEVDIIIADGGSTDGSTGADTLYQLGVTTLLTKTGPGKLSAQLRMAIHHCLAQQYVGIITMDGNDKDGADGIRHIATALYEGHDFVQGSRFVQGGHAINTPRNRLLAIRLIHAPIISMAARHRFTDTTNGFRGYSRRILRDSRVAPLRDVFDTYELLAYLPIRASRLGYRVAEVPVTRAYPGSGATPTKIVGIWAQFGLFKILLRAGRSAYDPNSHGSGGYELRSPHNATSRPKFMLFRRRRTAIPRN